MKNKLIIFIVFLVFFVWWNFPSLSILSRPDVQGSVMLTLNRQGCIPLSTQDFMSSDLTYSTN